MLAEVEVDRLRLIVDEMEESSNVTSSIVLWDLGSQRDKCLEWTLWR